MSWKRVCHAATRADARASQMHLSRSQNRDRTSRALPDATFLNQCKSMLILQQARQTWMNNGYETDWRKQTSASIS